MSRIPACSNRLSSMNFQARAVARLVSLSLASRRSRLRSSASSSRVRERSSRVSFAGRNFALSSPQTAPSAVPANAQNGGMRSKNRTAQRSAKAHAGVVKRTDLNLRNHQPIHHFTRLFGKRPT